jgi:hypothetical protein
MDIDLDPPEDSLLRREENAAAADAADIGGRSPDYPGDEDWRGPRWWPLIEAGEGVAEGFDLAEQDLIEEATHGEERRSPEVDAFAPERESDRATSVYGEPDEIDPTEVVRDPIEGDEDPGAGPGLAPDR